MIRDCGSRGAAAGIAEEDLPYGHWLRVDSKRKLTSGVGNLSRVSAGRYIHFSFIICKVD